MRVRDNEPGVLVGVRQQHDVDRTCEDPGATVFSFFFFLSRHTVAVQWPAMARRPLAKLLNLGSLPWYGGAAEPGCAATAVSKTKLSPSVADATVIGPTGRWPPNLTEILKAS